MIEDVGLPVAVTLDVGVTLIEFVLVVLGVPELLGVCDGLAPNETDAVGLALIVDDELTVVVGVNDGVPVEDVVIVLDCEGVEDRVSVVVGD